MMHINPAATIVLNSLCFHQFQKTTIYSAAAEHN